MRIVLGWPDPVERLFEDVFWGGVLGSVLVSLEFLVLESCSLSFSLPFLYINAVEQRKATVIGPSVSFPPENKHISGANLVKA